jgi:hypothetical protein
MPGDHFWFCVEALACTFDGDPKAAEQNLSNYENHARKFAPKKRAKVRRNLVEIIGGLSRLEIRLAERDRGTETRPATLL